MNRLLFILFGGISANIYFSALRFVQGSVIKTNMLYGVGILTLNLISLVDLLVSCQLSNVRLFSLNAQCARLTSSRHLSHSIARASLALLSYNRCSIFVPSNDG